MCLGGGDVFAPEIGGEIVFGELALLRRSGLDGRRAGGRRLDDGLLLGRSDRRFVGNDGVRHGLRNCRLRDNGLRHNLMFREVGDLRGDRPLEAV